MSAIRAGRCVRAGADHALHECGDFLKAAWRWSSPPVRGRSGYCHRRYGPDGSGHNGPDHKFQGPKPGSPDRFIEAIDKRAGLELTDNQKQQIDKVLSEERAKHEAIRKDAQARIDKVLTPEQRAKRDQFLKDAAAKHAERLEKRAEQMQERAERLKDGPPPAR